MSHRVAPCRDNHTKRESKDEILSHLAVLVVILGDLLKFKDLFLVLFIDICTEKVLCEISQKHKI
jgi:hypothetical protein